MGREFNVADKLMLSKNYKEHHLFKELDEMIDFSAYAPGEVIDVFDGHPIVRTVDGSLLIKKYESAKELQAGDVLA